jgi:RNA polymerase sigma-70 factor, ECF subfamily
MGADDQIADTTQLLLAWAGGDARALDALAPRIYQELHRLAVDFMKREREEPILQATALVHEVYLKLIDVQNVALEGKAHFFAIWTHMMRRILVDAARKRAASRHGGRLGRVHLDDVAHLKLSQDNDRQLIALNDALDELARGDPRKARVVELRYFAGLNVQDTAAVLKVSAETVRETGVWRAVGCNCKSGARTVPERRARRGALTSERRPCLPGSGEVLLHHRVTAISLDPASPLGWEAILPSCVPIAHTPCLSGGCGGEMGLGPISALTSSGEH